MPVNTKNTIIGEQYSTKYLGSDEVEQVQHPVQDRLSGNKYLLLLNLIIVGFGCSICTDSVGSLQEELMRKLDISVSEFSLMYSVSSWSQVVLALTTSFFIHRLGGEFIQICLVDFCTRHFQGKELKVISYGIGSIARLGSCCMFEMSSPLLDTIRTSLSCSEDVGLVLLAVGGFTLVSLLSVLIINYAFSDDHNIIDHQTHPRATDKEKWLELTRKGEIDKDDKKRLLERQQEKKDDSEILPRNRNQNVNISNYENEQDTLNDHLDTERSSHSLTTKPDQTTKPAMESNAQILGVVDEKRKEDKDKTRSLMTSEVHQTFSYPATGYQRLSNGYDDCETMKSVADDIDNKGRTEEIASTNGDFDIPKEEVYEDSTSSINKGPEEEVDSDEITKKGEISEKHCSENIQNTRRIDQMFSDQRNNGLEESILTDANTSERSENLKIVSSNDKEVRSSIDSNSRPIERVKIQNASVTDECDELFRGRLTRDTGNDILQSSSDHHILNIKNDVLQTESNNGKVAIHLDNQERHRESSEVNTMRKKEMTMGHPLDVQQTERETKGTIHLRYILSFPLYYWLIVLINLSFHSLVYTLLPFSQKFLADSHNLSLTGANSVTSFFSLASTVSSPCCSAIIEKLGREMVFVKLGLIIGLLAYLLLTLTLITPYLSMLVLAVSNGLLIGSISPMLRLILPEYKLPTATGLYLSIQHGFFALNIILAGKIAEVFGYTAYAVFIMALILVGLIGAVWLWMKDRSGSGILSMSFTQRARITSTQSKLMDKTDGVNQGVVPVNKKEETEKSKENCFLREADPPMEVNLQIPSSSLPIKSFVTEAKLQKAENINKTESILVDVYHQCSTPPAKPSSVRCKPSLANLNTTSFMTAKTASETCVVYKELLLLETKSITRATSLPALSNVTLFHPADNQQHPLGATVTFSERNPSSSATNDVKPFTANTKPSSEPFTKTIESLLTEENEIKPDTRDLSIKIKHLATKVKACPTETDTARPMEIILTTEAKPSPGPISSSINANETISFTVETQPSPTKANKVVQIGSDPSNKTDPIIITTSSPLLFTTMPKPSTSEIKGTEFPTVDTIPSSTKVNKEELILPDISYNLIPFTIDTNPSPIITKTKSLPSKVNNSESFIMDNLSKHSEKSEAEPVLNDLPNNKKHFTTDSNLEVWTKESKQLPTKANIKGTVSSTEVTQVEAIIADLIKQNSTPSVKETITQSTVVKSLLHNTKPQFQDDTKPKSGDGIKPPTTRTNTHTVETLTFVSQDIDPMHSGSTSNYARVVNDDALLNEALISQSTLLPQNVGKEIIFVEENKLYSSGQESATNNKEITSSTMVPAEQTSSLFPKVMKSHKLYPYEEPQLNETLSVEKLTSESKPDIKASNELFPENCYIIEALSVEEAKPVHLSVSVPMKNTLSMNQSEVKEMKYFTGNETDDSQLQVVDSSQMKDLRNTIGSDLQALHQDKQVRSKSSEIDNLIANSSSSKEKLFIKNKESTEGNVEFRHQAELNKTLTETSQDGFKSMAVTGVTPNISKKKFSLNEMRTRKTSPGQLTWAMADHNSTHNEPSQSLNGRNTNRRKKYSVETRTAGSPTSQPSGYVLRMAKCFERENDQSDYEENAAAVWKDCLSLRESISHLADTSLNWTRTQEAVAASLDTGNGKTESCEEGDHTDRSQASHQQHLPYSSHP